MPASKMTARRLEAVLDGLTRAADEWEAELEHDLDCLDAEPDFETAAELHRSSAEIRTRIEALQSGREIIVARFAQPTKED